MKRKKSSNDTDKRKKEMEEQKKKMNKSLGRIKHKILIMSGKGGVGKSSIAAYLSVALANRGYNVGLMDIDLHGPSIPHILGISGRLYIKKGQMDKAAPIQFLSNLEVVSIESLLNDRDSAVIWRGPLKGGVIRQFIADIEWNDLDYMIIDSPPGTGDEPLTIAQAIPDAKALIVTTPQEVSLADVRKSIHFCRDVKMDILGLIENMSGLQCPHCGKTIDVFNKNGGKITAENENLKFLGTLPMAPEVVEKGDKGEMSLLDNENLPITKAFNNIVDEIIRISSL